MNEKVSVIIRTKNESQWIGTCLQAVARQDYPDFEVIVVDNDSTDDTLSIVGRHDCKVVHIGDNEFNFSRALNRGIEVSDGTLLAMLSGHCLPADEQWLARLAMNFRDPRVVAVYGKQDPMRDSNPYDKRDLWITFGLDRKVQKRDYFFHNANSMIRRSVWDRIPFNEEINGVEDQDWAKKALKNDARIVYEPSARVFHHHGIHHGQSESRVSRVVRVIELIQQDLT